MQHVLMTGVTGFVGRVFARNLLMRFPHLHLWAVVRPSRTGAAAGRPELADLVDNPRFHVLSGDITVPGLGLPIAHHQCYPAVGRGFDTCFHFAAETEFRTSFRERTFATNLEGTRNVVAFCRNLPRFGTFYHISTAYVCGHMQGVSPEALLPARSFSNPYEESKHAAEHVVAASGLHWTTLRLGALMGDSTSGVSEADKMAYGLFNIYQRLDRVLRTRYAPSELRELRAAPLRILGCKNVIRHFICVDDAVALVIAVIENQPLSESIFHITNPRQTTVGAVHDAICDVLEIDYLAPVPELSAKLRPIEQYIRRSIEPYQQYGLVDEPRFDQSALRALIGDAPVNAIKPMTPERLHFLFQAHLERQRQIAHSYD